MYFVMYREYKPTRQEFEETPMVFAEADSKYAVAVKHFVSKKEALDFVKSILDKIELDYLWFTYQDNKQVFDLALYEKHKTDLGKFYDIDQEECWNPKELSEELTEEYYLTMKEILCSYDYDTLGLYFGEC